jgi:hypothetical protein
MSNNINNNIINNIKPNFWGPKLWYNIFTFASIYPENPTHDVINSAKQFFLSIKNLLPCKSCRNSYNQYILEDNTNINNNYNFSSRNNLIEFIFNLRNKVNNKKEIEYYITLNYFKKKLNLMICDDNNKLDSIINNLIEAPIIPASIEDNVYRYLNKKKIKYNINNTRSIIKNIKEFMINPDFNLKNSNFKLFYKRNNECHEIIKKIYENMSFYNYNSIESFKHNNELHIKLLCLGSTTLSKSDLLEVINNNY